MKNPIKAKKGNLGGLAIAGIFLVFIAVVGVGAMMYFGIGTKTLSINQAPPPNLNTQCQQNPAYTYSAIDAFASGTTVVGTDQIKNGADAPVSSLSAPKAGNGLQFWKSNATYFCDLKSDNAQCGSTTMQTKCIQNGTVTMSVRDLDNDVTLSNSGTAGTQNVTIGANEVHNLEVRFQSASKKAVVPFGGCVAVEYPTTITDVAVSGAGISSATACPYPWTYAVSSTSNTYKLFAVPAGFDKDGAGDLKRINVQLKSGSSNPSGVVKVVFAATNYYVANDGNFYLGIEKDKNADTTRTMLGGVETTFAAN